MYDNKNYESCDKAIIDLSKGNKEALSVIYDCMARMIFSIAYAITSNYSDAEDVLQETMISITKYAHNYSEQTNAKAWILTMVRHLAIDVVRKRKSTISIDEIAELPKLEQDSSQFEVLDMLKILDEEEKQLVLLRLYADRPYRDIARIMEISIFAAQKKYQRAIKKLKNYYSK